MATDIPVSISADLILSSVVHKYVYISVSISNHCWVSVVDVNFGLGKSTICEYLLRTSSDHLQLRICSIVNGQLTGIYNLGISVHAGKKVIIYVLLNQLVCPNPLVQWNLGVNQFHPPMQKHQLRGQGSPLLCLIPVEKPLYSHTKI